jgi:hypothetical protein
MKKEIIALFSLMSLTGLVHADNDTLNTNPWSMEAAFGMANYADVTLHDGQTAIGRLSIGHTLLTKSAWQLSLEAGIQSGNTMRLDLPKESIDALGGVPIQSTMKPLLDVLLGFNAEPISNFPMMIWLKSGVAYRSLQLDRESVPDLTGFAPEIQAGIGYRINQQTTFNIGYQRIWGKKPELTINTLTETGTLHNIPSQQAVMLGFTFNF